MNVGGAGGWGLGTFMGGAFATSIGFNACAVTCSATIFGFAVSWVSGYSAKEIADKVYKQMVDESDLQENLEYLNSPKRQYEIALQTIDVTDDISD